MNTLYIGDIMGSCGIRTVQELMPKVRREHQIDFIIAQGENVSDGKGITNNDYKALRGIGIDFLTGGNHSFDKAEIFPRLSDPEQPIIRPANYPATAPGAGWKYAHTPKGEVLVVSLLGQIVGKGASQVVDNPLATIDMILEEQKDVPRVATFVNFHGDFSSEKVVVGQYLDGRVTAVIGDHWHVPTADARILPLGTAHVTDVGMVGTLNSSLGVTTSIIVERWRNGQHNKNELADEKPFQFNAVLVHSDESTGLAHKIERIQYTIE